MSFNDRPSRGSLPPPKFGVERRGNGQRTPLKPPKPRAWSHQDDLKAWKGERVSLHFADSRPGVVGKLVEADQFTIKIVSETLGAREEVYFKSALRSFHKYG